MIGITRARRTPLADAWRVMVFSTYGGPDLMSRVFGESLDQFISKEMKAAMKRGPLDISPGDLGSCQYDSVSLVYNMWFESRKLLAFDEALYSFGVRKLKVNYAGIKDAKEELIRDLEEDIADMESEDPSDWEEDIQRSQENILRARVAITYDTLFEASRDAGWDLWSTVFILSSSLKIDMETIPKLGALPSFVPIISALVQEDSYLTGLKCALAKELGLIRSEDSFVDFPT